MSSPESIFGRLIFADARRRVARGASPHQLSPTQRIFREPFFNSIGMLLGVLWRLAPFSWRRSMDTWLCQKMGGHSAEPNPSLTSLNAETVALANQLLQKTGKWPAFLFFTAHAPTEGPLQWVRFELLRQGLFIAFSVSEAGRKAGYPSSVPQCILAVDPYALDSVSVPVGAMYAAFIRQVYFAYDRQYSTQSIFQRRLFLWRTGYPWAGLRLFRRLQRGIPVLMALGGGIAGNARLLYAAREFVQRLKFPNPRSRRTAEYDWIRKLEGQDHDDPALDGHLSAEVQRSLVELLETWGFSKDQAIERLHEFREEFSRAVPYRERLWNALFHRVVLKGRGLIVISGDYAEAPPHVSLGSPLGFYSDASKQLVRIQNGQTDSIGRDVRVASRKTAIDFALQFRKDS